MEIKTLYQSITPDYLTMVVSYNGRKFMISCKQMNPSSEGTLSVMNSDGEFKRVVSNRELGFNIESLYFLKNNGADGVRKQKVLEEALPKFYDFIKKVY